MQRTHMYVPENLNREIDYLTKTQGKTKAKITRMLLQEGLRAMQPQKFHSALALVNFSKAAKKFKGNAPKDLSRNHDYYLWGGENIPFNTPYADFCGL